MKPQEIREGQKVAGEDGRAYFVVEALPDTVTLVLVNSGRHPLLDDEHVEVRRETMVSFRAC